MRGAFEDQGGLFSYILPEARIPTSCPLRKIRELVREVLSEPRLMLPARAGLSLRKMRKFMPFSSSRSPFVSADFFRYLWVDLRVGCVFDTARYSAGEQRLRVSRSLASMLSPLARSAVRLCAKEVYDKVTTYTLINVKAWLAGLDLLPTIAILHIGQCRVAGARR
jgi:hypothetical protein